MSNNLIKTSVQLTQDQVAQLQDAASEDFSSLAHQVRRAVAWYLQQRNRYIFEEPLGITEPGTDTPGAVEATPPPGNGDDGTQDVL
jgi:hypothetical protein